MRWPKKCRTCKMLFQGLCLLYPNKAEVKREYKTCQFYEDRGDGREWGEVDWVPGLTEEELRALVRVWKKREYRSVVVRRYLKEKMGEKYAGWYAVYLEDIHKELSKPPHGEKTESNRTVRNQKLKDNAPVYKITEGDYWRR